MDKIEKGCYVDFGEHQGIVEEVIPEGELYRYVLSECFDDPDICEIWANPGYIKVYKNYPQGTLLICGDWKGVIDTIIFGKNIKIKFFYCRNIRTGLEEWNYTINVNSANYTTWQPE